MALESIEIAINEIPDGVDENSVHSSLSLELTSSSNNGS